MTITLHNTLGVNTSLLFQGQQVPLDRKGADPLTGTKTYTFTPSHAGTFLYEAGLVKGAQYQTAMGLHGALVVRPASGSTAYGDAATAYTKDAVLVLSEIDPLLNNAANPAAFDMRTYVPRYSLINGKAYPQTTPIPAAGGDTVLLRYVNAGVDYHSMGVLGAQQTVVGVDGNKLDFPRSYVAQTFGPGESADALVKVPAAAAGASLSVYDAAQTMVNSSAAGVGGMLTTVEVAGAAASGDTAGPVSSNLALNGSSLTARVVDDAKHGGSAVTAAEFYLDTVGGTGQPMTADPAAPGTFNGTLTQSLVGDHVLYVRGQDAAGNWGPFSSVLVTGADSGGPTTSGATLTPSLVGKAGATVKVSATANDSASGNSDIKAGEYFIDSEGAAGTGLPMTVSQTAPVASLDAVIEAATTEALGEGGHSVYVRGQDATGAWGDLVPVQLTVDETGPTIANSGALVVLPSSSTNGQIPYSNGTSSIRLNVTGIEDPISTLVNSAIAGGELFIDTVGNPGSGVPLRAVDGAFSDPKENAYVDIPLSTIRLLSAGNHTLSVRAKDSAGNWGPVVSTTLTVDKTAPVATGVSATPTPTQGARTVTVTATGTDNVGVSGAEVFLGTDPGVGKGTQLTTVGTAGSVSGQLDTSVLPEGTYTLKYRVRDAAGNWSAVGSTTATVKVTAPLSFSLSSGSGGRSANNVYRWDGATFPSGTVYNGPGNVDGYAQADATHVYLSFSNSSLRIGSVTYNDEDVVSYDTTNGAYTMVFDGSTNGLVDARRRNVNVDALSVLDGKLYYSVNGTTRPTGVNLPTGASHDIYRFDGTGATGSSTRVIDSSAAPYSWPNTNVDGLKVIDDTHVYLSFTGNTTVGGIPVQAGDVVAFNAGTWSVYFDASTHGLGNANVDAFDLP